MHLCSWEMVCRPKVACSLGLRHAKYFNIAFLSKLGWWLNQNKDKLWVKVIRSRFQLSLANQVHQICGKVSVMLGLM